MKGGLFCGGLDTRICGEELANEPLSRQLLEQMEQGETAWRLRLASTGKVA